MKPTKPKPQTTQARILSVQRLMARALNGDARAQQHLAELAAKKTERAVSPEARNELEFLAAAEDGKFASDPTARLVRDWMLVKRALTASRALKPLKFFKRQQKTARELLRESKQKLNEAIQKALASEDAKFFRALSDAMDFYKRNDCRPRDREAALLLMQKLDVMLTGAQPLTLKELLATLRVENNDANAKRVRRLCQKLGYALRDDKRGRPVGSETVIF